MRKRAELLTRVQQTNWPSNLPDLGHKIAYKAHRAGMAERFPNPAVQQSIEVALALIDSSDRLLSDLERAMVKTAKQQDADTFYRLQAVPGMGKILALVWLDERHNLARLPRVQDVVSYGRLGKCPKESAGTRYGSSSPTMGHAYLRWVLPEAVVLF